MPYVKGVGHIPMAGTGPGWDVVYGLEIAAAKRKRMDEDVTGRTDLDETRRLLYMVLLGGLTSERWYNLAGSLVNALAHHSKLVPADEVISRLRYLHDVDITLENEGEDRAWVQGLIDQITEQLGDGPA